MPTPPTPSPQTPARSAHDLPGRAVALLVFLLGVAMLVFVFVIAVHLFESPVPGLDLPVKTGSPAPPAVNIGASLAVFARSLLLLGVMTLAGSLIASRGAHLYFGTFALLRDSNSVTSGK